MNRRGEGEVWLLLFIVVAVIAGISAMGRTDFDACMSTCRAVVRENFTYVDTCYPPAYIVNNSIPGYDCEQYNETLIQSECFSQCKGSQGK